MAFPVRGRGCGRGSRRKQQKQQKRGSGGLNTSLTPTPGRKQYQVLYPQSVPFVAQLLVDTQQSWDATRAGPRPSRQVVGDKVVITQEVATCLSSPQVLVLTDQLMEAVAHPDRYLHVLVMVGYSFTDYLRDLQDELIDLNFKHIMFFLGSMQLGVLDYKMIQHQVHDLMTVIRQQAKDVTVTFFGLVPCPIDYPRSQQKCQSVTKSFFAVTDEFRDTKGWKCYAVDVFDEFLEADLLIKNVNDNFIDDIYLSPSGIRILHAAWLRYLGYFPAKAK